MIKSFYFTLLSLIKIIINSINIIIDTLKSGFIFLKILYLTYLFKFHYKNEYKLNTFISFIINIKIIKTI